MIPALNRRIVPLMQPSKVVDHAYRVYKQNWAAITLSLGIKGTDALLRHGSVHEGGPAD